MKFHNRVHTTRHVWEALISRNWFHGYLNSKDKVLAFILDQDIADKVTAEWKVMYKECSAKDPEAVTDLFKSVMGVFERELALLVSLQGESIWKGGSGSGGDAQ